MRDGRYVRIAGLCFGVTFPRDAEIINENGGGLGVRLHKRQRAKQSK
jgi:hypothetical protein